LRQVLGDTVGQKGSNITTERMRFDFSFDRKMTDEEKQKVEDWVNDKIKMGLTVVRREMPLAEAEKLGAQMEFGAKYPEIVSVYFIEDKDGKAISKEFCGGPHVKNTRELGQFKIQKEEAVAAGIRRIKAILL
jgi:alanyl-tRNA synthetase